jgi:alpha-beta hydrolase superfamily lysophospholipase
MAEYGERYAAFAKQLNDKGIVVYCQDHRGHGLTATMNHEQLGFLAPENGWQKIADDSFELDQVITNDYPKVPLFLMGHSMGSFLARTVMVQHSELFSGVIIMGTGCSKGMLGKIGKMIAESHIKKNGADFVDKGLDKLSFGSYLKKIPDRETSFDWLSRDGEQVRKYVDDPLCGFTCTASFYRDLLDGVAYANNEKNVAKLPKDLPLLIISGSMDPVGDWGKGVRKVYDLYKENGFSDIQLVMVDGARHELLNETDRKKTMNLLQKWIIDRI